MTSGEDSFMDKVNDFANEVMEQEGVSASQLFGDLEDAAQWVQTVSERAAGQISAGASPAWRSLLSWLLR
jgi:hypothetical protein